MISASSAAGVGYYSGGGDDTARDASGRNYYTGAVDHGERPGMWSGTLAQALGLIGVVEAATMEQVYERFLTPDGQPIGNAPRNYKSPEERLDAALAKEPDALPERIEAIRSEIERTDASVCRGVDLTFSVPKSVTVAYVAAWRAEQEATRDGQSERADGFQAIREAIDGAILDANQAALDYVSSVATTRTGKHGAGYAGQWLATPGLVVASFPQLTSRADDPQYHVHNVVLNRAQAEDGRIGALDTRDLGQQRHAYSAVADRILAERLQDAGLTVSTRPDGIAREIVGIDQDMLDAFSQRRAQITKAMAPVVQAQEERLGRDLNALERSRLAQTINLVTRESKDEKDIDWAAKLEDWQDRITDEIGAGLGPVAEQLLAMVEDAVPSGASEFSPEAVMAQAIHAVAQEKAAWTRADLLLEIDRALPDRLGLSTGGAVELLDRLADAALVFEGVIQVSGNSGALPPTDLVPGAFTRPSDAKYAAPETLEAENLIIRAATNRSGVALDAKAVGGWLSLNCPTILPDQRAAVVGLASTDAALSQLVGPAGTGKSFTAGALAGAWTALSDGGRVIGLATSQVATEVLKGDGVDLSFNIAAWNAMQSRVASGALRGDEITLTERDLVIVDETSMVSTANASAIREAVEAAGARAIATGDPAQLGAVGAGGVMELLTGRAETYVLSDVQRFSEDWERSASLGLREGNLDALREYDLHGRLVEAGSMDEAIAAAARAAAAERLSGNTVSVTADTNADAYRVSEMVRDHLVAAGLVEEEGVILDRTGGVAGIGDEVMTRQIDYQLGVLNGSRFEVIGTGEDGSLSVRGDDGVVRELPSQYVTQHVQHAYASTVHGSQGKTVDAGFTVTGGNTSASALYVGMTRGRERNTAFVALGPQAPSQGRLQAPTEQGGQVRVEDPQDKASAIAVLSEALSRESQSRAALTEQAEDADRLASMDTTMGRIEELTHLACRARLDGDLDRLVEDGVLSEDSRARLASDQSTDHLSRVCRAAEQAGMDPAQVLREAIEDRPFDGLRSIAQGIAGRITSEHDVAASQPGTATVPARLPEDHTAYLEHLHEKAADRARDLGSLAAQELPAWAEKTLGAVPEDAMARLEWEEKAGAIAAYREAKGLDGDRALSPAPGLSQTEARAAWWDAWSALGKPQETRTEAALSEGALQARVAAWEREQAWAPAHANDSLRQAELDAEEARHEVALALASGDEENASRWEQTASERQAVASAMATVADARGDWAEQTAITQDLAERAASELRERGLEPGREPDRISAEEWLEHQRETDARDEAVREVTELDVPIVEDDTETESEDSGLRDAGSAIGGGADQIRGGSAATTEAATPEGSDDATPVSKVTATDSGDESQEEPDRAEKSKSPAEAEDDDEEDEEKDDPRADPANYAVWNPAKAVAPIEPDDAELHALVAVARTAHAVTADRTSEEAAHDALEAEQAAPPEADDSGDVAEASHAPALVAADD
jgi:conjugative relaxase-like TrwC/TraI family protein